MLKQKCLIAKLGEPILRQKAKKVKNIASIEVQELIAKMISCVKRSKGVGLAAPQIFEPYQILVISSSPNDRYPNAPFMENEVLINPKIIKKSKIKVKAYEGCLSIPGIRAQVPRHTKVEVKYTTPKGEKKQVVYEDFIARIFQHEYDHLKGKVYLDRVEYSNDIVSEEFYLNNIFNT